MASKAIGLLTMVFGADMKGFDKAMKKAERSVGKFGKNMEKLGRNMTRNITLPLVAVGGAAAKLSADFDTSMTKIQTLVGLTGEEVRGMKDRVLELSGETARSPKELADALFFLTSAGLRGENALMSLEMVAKGTAAGLGDMEALSKTVAAAQNAYGVETLSAAEALDVFGGMVQTGMFKSEELAQVLGTNLGLSANLGISFEEVGAFISTYTKTTGDATSATTGFGAVMMSFAKIAPIQEKALAKIGMSADGLREMLGKEGLQKTLLFLDQNFKANNMQLSEFFTKSQALKGVMGVLGNQTETYVDILDDLARKQGFVDNAFSITANTTGFQMKQAFNDLKVAGVQLGDALAPIIRSLANMVTTLARSFSNLTENQKKSIAQFLAITAAVGPLVFVFGRFITIGLTVVKVMGKLRLAAMANPYILLAVAIGSIVVALKNWASSSEKVRTNMDRIAEIDADVKRNTGAQVERVRELTRQLQNENLSLGAKKRVLNELKQISPQYYGSLSANKLDLTELTKATQLYTQSIIKQAEAESLAQKIANLKVQKQEDEIFVKNQQDNLTGGFLGAFSGDHVIKGLIKQKKARIASAKEDLDFFQNKLTKTLNEVDELANESAELIGDKDRQTDIFDPDQFKGLFEEIEVEVTELQKLQNEVREAETNLRNLMITGNASDEEIAKKKNKLSEAQEVLNKHQKEYNQLMGIATAEAANPFRDLEDAVDKANTALQDAIINGEDYTQQLADFEKATAKLKEKQDEYNDAVNTTTKQELPAFIQLIDKFFPKLEIFGKSLAEIFQESGETIAGAMDLAIGAFEAFNKRATILAENQKKRDLKELDEKERREAEMINNSSMTEEQRQRALALMQGKIADERVAIEEAADKKLRNIKKRTAILDKALAITSVVQNTAAAIMKAFAQTGIFGGPIAAGIIGALGAAQIALIASTPIPLAQGGIISGPTTALMGEYPSAGAGNPEVVAPLNKLKDMIGSRGGTQRIQIFGRLTGNDIYLSNQSESINRLRTT